MSIEHVRDAYTRRADEYIHLLGSIDDAAAEDQQLVAAWAAGIEGLILDVGCGPGQWTNFLHARGADVIGIDPVGAFIDDARRRYPWVRYRQGRAENLDVAEASVGGILAWYSLIHIRPEDLETALAELARVCRPGGSLLVGFFDGPEMAKVDHAVTSAYAWPIPKVARRLELAGFVVTETHARADPGRRPHAVIVAMRSARSEPCQPAPMLIRGNDPLVGNRRGDRVGEEHDHR